MLETISNFLPTYSLTAVIVFPLAFISLWIYFKWDHLFAQLLDRLFRSKQMKDKAEKHLERPAPTKTKNG